MSLADQVDVLFDHIVGQGKIISHNDDLFNIYEGELLKYVLADLQNQLSAQSYDIAKSRVPPINVLQRLIDKLSKIYQQQPLRHVNTDIDTDSELLDYYERSMSTNAVMNCSNEFFNLFKNNLVQPFIHNGRPRLRSLASNSFTVYSDSDVDPNRPTHVITFHTAKENGKSIPVYYVYTATEFMIFDHNRKIRYDLMARFANDDGINIAGAIPFIYVNKSKNLLIPKIDTDVKKMVVLLPVMLADLNFAVMMQAFSIMYGIDMDATGMKVSPNAFWMFKSDPTTDKTPQIGVLKPQVDIQPTMELIQAEMGLWLQTKGIKPGSVGQLTEQNFASGISKMIDEMDTSEERQKQVSIYQDVESEMWNLITRHLHPMWRSQNLVDQSLDFSSGVVVETRFHEQLPMLNRGDIVRDLKAEIDAGFITRKQAIQRLNPRLTMADVENMMEDIDDEKRMETIGRQEEAQANLDRPEQEQPTEE
jgi:hypothetical protein